MKRLATLLMLAALARGAAAQPVVDLISFGPGDLIFTRFGHGALCVEPSPGASPDDITCYNYGVTDFQQPHLVTKFMRGGVEFWVDTDTLGETLMHYQNQDRTIYRQRLLLTDAQRDRIIARLEHDILPENRKYKYDHFRDNCTTRLRDMLDQGLDGALARATTGRRFHRTFRDITYDGFSDMKGLLLVGEIVVGGSADEHPTMWQAMFLPDVLRSELTALRVDGHPVVGPLEVLYQRQGGDPSPGDPRTGRATLLMLAGLLGPLVFWACRRHGRARRITIAVAGGLLGLVAAGIDFVVLYAVSVELHKNLMVLVLWPSDSVLPVLAILARSPRARASRLLRGYLTVRAASLTLVALATSVGVIHQSMGSMLALTFALIGVPAIAMWLEVEKVAESSEVLVGTTSRII